MGVFQGLYKVNNASGKMILKDTKPRGEKTLKSNKDILSQARTVLT
jgi:hypothetical protein